MLTLDECTLYYYFLNSDAEPIKKGVKSWAAQVDEFSHTSKPNSKPASLKSKPASTKSHAASSSTRISSKSTLTETVVIKAEQKGRRELKADPSVSDDDVLVGGFEDEDETKGEERDAAIASPIKGKTRLTNSVSKCLLIHGDSGKVRERTGDTLEVDGQRTRIAVVLDDSVKPEDAIECAYDEVDDAEM